MVMPLATINNQRTDKMMAKSGTDSWLRRLDMATPTKNTKTVEKTITKTAPPERGISIRATVVCLLDSVTSSAFTKEGAAPLQYDGKVGAASEAVPP